MKGPPCDRKIHIHPIKPTTAAAPRRASLRAVLLATSALASAALPITVAHAGDATWSAAPDDGHFDNAKNWVGGAIPDGTATFGKSPDHQNLDITQNTTLGGITVTSGAGDYGFASSFDITFTGAGIAVQDGASATFVLGGTTTFTNSATAGSAIINLDDGGKLDISHLTSNGMSVGSLEGSGNVFLGNRNLAVGGNNLDSAFSGVIQDGTPGGGGNTGGSLTKEGTGALTLTGINTYTGATTVNGGFLVVDGSISSAVTVNAGGTLAGTGTVASTTINVGGTLAPGHSDGSFGTLKVQGDLLFTQGPGTTSTYLVQVSPANATSTSVTGSARFNGATVQANFAPGTYITQHYTILHAGDPLSDKFGRAIG